MNLIFNILGTIFRLLRIVTFWNYLDDWVQLNSLTDADADEDADDLNIVTWNIQELFLYKSARKQKLVIDKLKEFSSDTDIICLQEVFCDDMKKTIIATLKESHSFWVTGNMRKKYLFGEDSGLLVMSKYPITFHKITDFDKMCTGMDTFANKGVLYFQVGSHYFATTHLQSNCKKITETQWNMIYDQMPIEFRDEDMIIIGDINESLQGNSNMIATHENEVIDVIYSKKNPITNVTIPVPLEISDHNPVKATIIKK